MGEAKECVAVPLRCRTRNTFAQWSSCRWVSVPRAISTWSKLFAIIEKTSEVSKTSEVCVCAYKEKLPGYFGLYFTPCRT